MTVHAVVGRPVGRTVAGIVVAVPLVPLFVAQFVSLLRLVLPELIAVAVQVSFFLLVVAQSAPFRAAMRAVRVHAPVARAAVGRSVPVPLPGGAIHVAVVRAGRAVAVAISRAAADPDREPGLSERRSARE